MHSKEAPRRRHSPEFKERVLAPCAEPGVSVAGDVAYKLNALTASDTEVLIDMQYSLQGPLAQFSRSGLVRDFVRRMVADFGKNVARRMDPTRSDSERNKTPQMNPVAPMLGVMWDRAKQLFTRSARPRRD